MTDNRTVEIHHTIRKLARALQTLPLDELPEVSNIAFTHTYSRDEVEVSAQLGVRQDTRGLRAWRDALPAAVIVAQELGSEHHSVEIGTRGALAGVPFYVWTVTRNLPLDLVAAVGKATTPAAAADMVLAYLDDHAAKEVADMP